ncbi:MAG: hypothetical protein ACRBB0_19295 [Pelagimonas sp.]|uniref:hypothetical protein n=1 Tax=Pelagimonas sp. TaxID=2073170 RepID=UPI003D6BB305
MRDFFAIIAIILAVVGLGVFRVPDENALVAAGIKVAAEGAVYQEKHPVRIEVKGRAITASGRVESQDEARQIEVRLAALEGVETVVGDWTILPNAAPFELRFTKTPDATTATGYVPDAQTKQAIADALGLEDVGLEDVGLVVAAGVPDRDWAEIAVQLAQEIATTRRGDFSLKDRSIHLSGDIDFPTDKQAFDSRLSDLPEGYSTTTDITVLDDGTPYRLLVTKDPHLGVTFQGKLPPDYTLPDLNAVGAHPRGDVTAAAIAHHAPGFEQAVPLGLTLLSHLPKGAVTVTPGTISVSGGPISDDLAKGYHDTALADLPEGYALSFTWTPEPDPQPLTLTVDWDGADLALSGHVPNSFLETAPGQLPDDLPAVVLQRAGFCTSATLTLTRSPFPDLDGWEDPFWQALGGLKHLQDGQLTFDVAGLRITGTAHDPQARRRAFRALGDTAELDVMLVDDGAPAQFLLSFDVTTGASVEGKLPAGLSPAAIAEIIGIEELRGAPPVSPDGGPETTINLLTAMQGWLSEIEGFVLSYDTSGIAITVEAMVGQNPDELRQSLELALKQTPEQAQTQDQTQEQAQKQAATTTKIRVVPSKPPLEGSRRTHIILDQAQIFADGYWLPSLSFSPTIETCDAQMAQAPQVPFENGRFVPAMSAYWPLAHLAAIARSCSRFGDLTAEISAEVGSSELPVLNRQLSRRRAEAIRQELLARGVSADRLTTRPATAVTGPDKLVITWR